MKTLITSLILVCYLAACDKEPKTTSVTLTPDYKKAESLLYQRSDSAFYYYNKVVSNSKDSLLIAMAYGDMALMQSDAGDYFGSQESLVSSLHYLDEQKEKDFDCLSFNYNELGTVSLNLKNYDAALIYYDQALKFAQDEGFKLTFLNNKAVVYQKKKNYSLAIDIYDSIIDQTHGDQQTYARVLSNRAKTKWLQNPGYNATPELWMALQIRTSEKDVWGQNASYAHLSDYYAHSRQDSGLIYARKMYSTALYLESPDDEVEALQKLINLSPPDDSKKYFTRYQYLNDSIQTARNSAKNQFALIRYDAEKNKADNLILQKENSDKRNQITWQWFMISGIILLASFAFLWYRRRKQQILKEQQLKTSQHVHDVVANGLYLLINQIEHNKCINLEELLSRLESLHERSRDISYKPVDVQSNTEKRISDLLISFSSDNTKVSLAGNDAEIWSQLSPKIQKDLEFILENLMINMQKHSQARNISVRFEKQQSQILIHYQDDGIGNVRQINFGNGLKNTENRIRSFGGGITFENNQPTGLKILIKIPI